MIWLLPEQRRRDDGAIAQGKRRGKRATHQCIIEIQLAKAAVF